MQKKQIPVVIPTPQSMKLTGKPFRVENFSTSKGSNVTLNELLGIFSKNSGIVINYSVNSLSQGAMLYIGSLNDPKIKESLVSQNLLKDYEALNNDGYILTVNNSREKPEILIASKTAAGQYYGFVSLEQLFNKQMLTPAIIIDQPGFEQRGIVFGKIENFSKGPINKDTGNHDGIPYLEQMKKYKLNFIWLAAWDNTYYKRTSLPIQDVTKKKLKLFLEKCRKYFITPSLGLRPYRQQGHSGRLKGGVMYSSEKDINGVADNLITLYKLGFTNLYLTFDDQPKHKFFLYEADKKKFKHIAEAHLYFIDQVYKKLKKNCPDVKFRVISLLYSLIPKKCNDFALEYCKIISKLPQEIEFVWTGHGASSEDARWYSELNGGRKLIFWSNFFPGHYERLKYMPVFMKYPYGDGDSNLPKYSTGHFFLPVGNDAAGLGWMTAADYMWNPQNYNGEISFKRALAKVTGTADNGELIDYMNLVDGFYKEKGIPGFTLNEKMANVNHLKSVMGSSVKKIKNKINQELYVKLLEEKTRITSYLEFLTGLYKSRPVPVKALKLDSKLVIDGRLSEAVWNKADIVDGFLLLGSKKKAKLATKARFLYDQKNLYIGVWFEEPKVKIIKDKFLERDSHIFVDNGVEFFLQPENRGYFHIVTNASGAVYDERITKGKTGYQGHDSNWNGQYTLKTHKDKNSWSVEIAIPWKVLESTPTERFYFNITRNRYIDGHSWQTYAPLLGGRFHMPQWFWPLECKQD
ncbi:MAG: beta-N-acetylglucosaminidase domain-containing protein [Victivallaceae bacterium]|nr:beta-N-acetylglucosaminidase domain-containing protein [Victivallaceae bacterium]